jgi:autotransporter adhesin
LQNQISQLQNQINQNETAAYAGTAVALAAAGLRYDDRPGKFSTSAGVSAYHGQVALAGGVGVNSEDGKWRFGGAFSLAPTLSRPEVGVSVAATFTWN